jgi:hypothetical protein
MRMVSHNPAGLPPPSSPLPCNKQRRTSNAGVGVGARSWHTAAQYTRPLLPPKPKSKPAASGACTTARPRTLSHGHRGHLARLEAPPATKRNVCQLARSIELISSYRDCRCWS